MVEISLYPSVLQNTLWKVEQQRNLRDIFPIDLIDERKQEFGRTVSCFFIIKSQSCVSVEISSGSPLLRIISSISFSEDGKYGVYWPCNILLYCCVYNIWKNKKIVVFIILKKKNRITNRYMYHNIRVT